MYHQLYSVQLICSNHVRQSRLSQFSMPLTKEEKAWAELQLASFLIHQSRKTLSSFWPSLRASFLSQFPLTGLTVDSQPALVEELKFQVSSGICHGRYSHDYLFQSLKNFFNNQNTRTRKRGTPSLEPATSGVTRTRRSGRAHTKREIYSRMYYNTECKQNVNSEISGCGPGVTKGERMSIRNKHIDLGWEAARGNPEKMAKINTVLEAEKAKKQECESS